jgi:hypothetical protein
MVTDLFRPPKDDWLQYTYVDLYPFLEDYPFEHSEQSPMKILNHFSCSNFDEHKDLVSPKKLETHTTDISSVFILGIFAGMHR